ncbi:hypothetical protein [Arsenicicoccus dermatophilus]|uniref:hypothetical protein n=1 Tax=Arsenicicoccus dermatophilus TaxID=1076331 RepID=UPI001F4CAA25|nr:hypothetical protein [Arsenicicoccus dermatophilus]MCH8613638.1 hypothetical protein [Arsenicicoccus dermatophilus]
MDEAMTCGTCGRQVLGAEAEQAQVRWSFGVERGRTVWTCDACSRWYARSIEGRLDSQWW